MIWLLMVGCMGKVKLIHKKKNKNNIVQKIIFSKNNIFKKIIFSKKKNQKIICSKKKVIFQKINSQKINFQKYYSKKYDKLSYNIFIINFVEILWARLCSFIKKETQKQIL